MGRVSLTGVDHSGVYDEEPFGRADGRSSSVSRCGRDRNRSENTEHRVRVLPGTRSPGLESEGVLILGTLSSQRK